MNKSISHNSISISQKNLEETKLSDQNQKILKEIKKNTFEDRGFGCVIGAFTADACGSFLEFNRFIGTDE